MKIFINIYSCISDMFNGAYRKKLQTVLLYFLEKLSALKIRFFPYPNSPRYEAAGHSDFQQFAPLRVRGKQTVENRFYWVACNWYLAPALLVFISFLLSGCEKEDSPAKPPSIQLIQNPGSISGDTTIGFGELMTFTIEASRGSDNLTNLIAFRTGTGLTQQRVLDTSMNTPWFIVNKSFTKSPADTEYWTFVVRDKNRLSDSVSLVITRDTTADYGPVWLIESVLMSAQDLGSPGSFFSFQTGVYDLNAAQQRQDETELLYYYYGEDENVIASPGANIESGVFEGDLENWTTRLTTRFTEIELSGEDFYAIENDSLLVAIYPEGDGKRKSKNLAAGKTFSFKTQDAKFGIFRIIEVVGQEAGTIEIDIKVQDK